MMLGRIALAIALLSLPAPVTARQYPLSHPEMHIERAQKFVEDRDEHLRRYGVPSLEELAGPDVTVFRAFYESPFRGLGPLVQFQRLPGEEPRVIVFQLDGWKPPISATITEATWIRLLIEAQYFDEDFDPGPPPEPGPEDPVVVCTDSSVMMVEIIDDEGTIRRRARDTCIRGMLNQFGDLLFEQALAAFPHCYAIDPEADSYLIHSGLMGCATLEGDRAAAAQVWEHMADAHLFDVGEGDGILRYLTRFLDSGVNARLDGGLEARGREKVGDIWANQIREADFTFDRIIGHTAMRVTVVGRLVFETFNEANEIDERMMPVRIEWERGYIGGDFSINLIEAGATIGEPGSPLPASGR